MATVEGIAMLANFLIGLREGLEAALVVAILAAYLVKTGRTERLRWLWLGVGSAIGLSLAIGGGLTLTARSLSFTAQEAFGGFASILAVALVTWMVFWMRRVARGLRGELHAQTDRASGGPAMALVGFVAVGREGLETALFLWSSTKSAGNSGTALLGAVIGLLSAATAGWLFYRGALKLNISRFFRWSGAALVIIAAGVLAYGIHDLQEANILPGISSLAFDVSGTIPPSSWYAVLLKGTIGFTPVTTWLQLIIGWGLYLPAALIAYFWPSPASRTATTKVPEKVSA